MSGIPEVVKTMSPTPENIAALEGERNTLRGKLEDCQAELTRARAEAAVMVKALDAVDLSGDTCVVCRMYQEQGHDGDCALAAALHSDLAVRGRLVLAIVEAARTERAARIELSEEIDLFGPARRAAIEAVREAELRLWDALIVFDRGANDEQANTDGDRLEPGDGGDGP